MKNFFTKPLILFLPILSASFIAACAGETSVVYTSEHTDTSALSESVETVSEESVIYVSVSGHVLNPGVYILPEGSRVYEAINAAGGVTDDGTLDGINTAVLLEDEAYILIPGISDSDETNTSEGMVAVGELTASESGETGKININTADLSSLMTLSGIGKAKAEAIISYRETNGNFEAIEDIKNVSGIKDGVFESIKDEITVR